MGDDIPQTPAGPRPHTNQHRAERPVDSAELRPHAAEVLRTVARRILAWAARSAILHQDSGT